jgi:hypothetical protein
MKVDPRAICGIAAGWANWTFFGGDEGGQTAAVLRSLVASCQRVGIDPFVWLQDVLARTASHPITRICEFSHNRAPGTTRTCAFCSVAVRQRKSITWRNR